MNRDVAKPVQANLWSDWIEGARAGSNDALGRLLESCRRYLILVANEEMGHQVQSKGGASDLVQETFLDAQRDFAKFHGGTEEELRAWLRKILRNNLANFVRSFCDTEMRKVSREVPLDQAVGIRNDDGFCTNSPSPCHQMVQEERAGRLEKALSLLPADYRQVVILRNRERMTFDEIGRHMGRSAEAIRKVWARAIEKLREQLGDL